MKKLISLALVGILGFSFVGCGGSGTGTSASDTATTETTAEATDTQVTTEETDTQAEGEEETETVVDTVTLTIGATSVPHEEILNSVKEGLVAQGVNLEIVAFTEYTLINPATTDGSLDGNFFQHEPYLNDYNTNSGGNLINYGPIHIEPLGLYSSEYTELPAEFPVGATVAIPNDSSNATRALKLLADNGLITLPEDKTENITPFDVVENPYEIKFSELDAAMIPRSISEVNFAVINSNYALEAGIVPAEEAIAIENPENNPYANVLAINQENKDNEAVKILYEALTSEETRAFIEEKYSGSVIPAF